MLSPCVGAWVCDRAPQGCVRMPLGCVWVCAGVCIALLMPVWHMECLRRGGQLLCRCADPAVHWPAQRGHKRCICSIDGRQPASREWAQVDTHTAWVRDAYSNPSFPSVHPWPCYVRLPAKSNVKRSTSAPELHEWPSTAGPTQQMPTQPG